MRLSESSSRLLYSSIPQFLHPRSTHCSRGELDFSTWDTRKWHIDVKLSTIVSGVSGDRVVGLLWQRRHTL